MEKKPSVYRLTRAKVFLKKHSNKKFVSLDMLAKGIGVYSDVLADDLLIFSPLILMDPTVNMQTLLSAIEDYLAEEKTKKAANPKPIRITAKKKELAEYKDYADFIYRKLAGPGGLLSPCASLNDHDLCVLDVLIKKEIKKRAKMNKGENPGRSRSK